MSRRLERVAKQIKQDLAVNIPQLKNPDIGFATVTKVELSSDLSRGKVYVSILPTRGHEDIEKCLNALQHSAGYLQSQIGKGMRLRVIPVLRFYLDKTAEAYNELSALISKARATDIQHSGDEELEADND